MNILIDFWLFCLLFYIKCLTLLRKTQNCVALFLCRYVSGVKN